ncbi:MAG: low specificity L-threonine aldolase [Bacteroidales bacterium]|nr:low specificity L-threonine aldolase [Bacteroidales bacterium]
MAKYSFRNDYSEGAHRQILETLLDTSLIQDEGYGEDEYCKEAISLIREKIQNPQADIHFVSGGTQANLIVISSMLKSYESIVAATTSHIFTHEAGAIEYTGHKINNVETKNGKLKVCDIQSVIDFHTDEHMVKPKAVFISNATELGTVYNKKELEELSAFCKKNKLYLYLDGARLGSALCSEYNDFSISELAKLVDVFYIGGTKNGALIGEAIVIVNEQLKENFRFHLKQKGALLAKGRILGIQFLELFKDDLFFDLAKHANLMATNLSIGIKKLEYSFLTEPASNQIFPILPNTIIEKISEKYGFYVWSKFDENNSVIRLVTSWATQEKFVNEFIEDLEILGSGK